MTNTKFTYNPKTCRYEPTRITGQQILGYCFALLLMSALLFGGIAYLQGRFFTTQKTLDLRAENKAMQKHFALLTLQLNVFDATLTDLRATEKSIESKLFTEVTTPTARKPARLPVDVHEARELLQHLKTHVRQTYNGSRMQNYSYASALKLNPTDMSVIAGWPTGIPIEDRYLKVASGFGKRIHPFHKGTYQHQGLDFAAPKGVPVFATGSGKVVDIGRSNLQVGYGNYIEIDHGNGLVTRYAHLENIAVKTGQHIRKGAVIGSVGMSGGASAPHLHYEVIRDDEQVDPMLFMQEVTSMQFVRLKEQSNKKNQSLD
jgi:murein DD-endopeptidase MepM/ murein hydrolase activator NlpD